MNSFMNLMLHPIPGYTHELQTEVSRSIPDIQFAMLNSFWSLGLASAWFSIAKYPWSMLETTPLLASSQATLIFVVDYL